METAFMNSIMGNVQGKLIDAQKIREEREKELMIQREKMSENVRKLVRERTDLMNINHNIYNKDLMSISLNNLNTNTKNHNHYNFNHNPSSVDNLLNNPMHSSPTINIPNNESFNSINHIYKNINDNKKFLHDSNFNSNESSSSKLNDILNMWTFPKKKNINNDDNNSSSISNIVSNSTLINSSNEINKIDDSNISSSNTLFNEIKLINSPKKKKNEFYHINNRNVRLKSLKSINNKIGKSNNNLSNNNDDNNNNDDDKSNTKKKELENNDTSLKKENKSESTYYYKERLYIKPYICEKQYRRSFDRYGSISSTSLNKIRNRNRPSEIDTTLFNGNPCIPESLKLRLEHERSKDNLDKIYFNNPNDIFKKNSALIDAIEAEKKLNMNIEKNMTKSNDLLFNVEDDDTLVEHDIVINDQNEKYRRTFDKEKFKKANNRYF
ncbi:hypothetical protein PIROE2DRAFT_11166 [Piromyces sp. E2]|nr:hypothetical protein PIROE2DRAFT_11166 [Piromyces sp. E2]|eukprot:OUM62530.1 hypothetical protein PIROE2DRAFT_11166 [Piromyces sp. E2]